MIDESKAREEIAFDPAFVIEKEEVEPIPENPAAYRRAEGEDDDGYDPWSDRTEESPLFEEDPWR